MISGARLALAATALLASPLISSPVSAAPLDARLAIELKAPSIERVADGFTFAESDDESVVHAELLPSGELLLEPKSKGVARVFVFAPRFLRVIEVAVGAALPTSDPAPAGPCAKPRITASCYPMWRAFLQHQLASEVPPIDFEIDGLQEQVKEAQAALDKNGMRKIALADSAFGIKLKNASDAAEERRALRTLWPWLLGPIRIDR